MATNLNKLVPLTLSQDIFLGRLEKDARFIFAAFTKRAKRDGWPTESINIVLEQAKEADDLDGIIQTLMVYCP